MEKETPLNTPETRAGSPSAVADVQAEEKAENPNSHWVGLFTERYLKSLMMMHYGKLVESGEGWSCYPYDNNADLGKDQSSLLLPSIIWAMWLNLPAGEINGYKKLGFLFDFTPELSQRAFEAPTQHFLALFARIEQSIVPVHEAFHNRTLPEFDEYCLQMRVRAKQADTGLWAHWMSQQPDLKPRFAERICTLYFTAESIFFFILPSYRDLHNFIDGEQPPFVHMYLPKLPISYFQAEPYFEGEFHYSRDEDLPRVQDLDNNVQVNNARLQEEWKKAEHARSSFDTSHLAESVSDIVVESKE